jgi:hypothetical protein
MKVMSKFFIIFALVSIFSSGVLAKTNGLAARYPHLRREKGFDFFGVYWRDAKPNEYVYLIPAHFGATVFVLIGNVIGTPVRAVYNLCNGDFKGDHYLPPIGFSTRYFAPVGGYILGSPFWALEKALYEYPVKLIMGEDEEYQFADDDEYKE